MSLFPVHAKSDSTHQLRWLRLGQSLTLAIVLSFGPWVPLVSAQNRPKPPNQGTLVTKKGGASRSCGDQRRVTALVPTEQIGNPDAIFPEQITGGFSDAGRPDFWFHVPYSGEELANLEFMVQDPANQNIYRLAIAPPAEAGLVKVALPETGPELEEGQRYRWFLKATVNCQLGEWVETTLQQENGWVERHRPETELAAQLAQASPQQQAQLYGEAGYWFDAVNAIARLRQAEPADPALQQDWQGLLATYKLREDLAQADFVDCCEVTAIEAQPVVSEL
ncbi:MAG: DUF928 domain-containing protein [Synechococcales cyanobacterium RM1_1_8]|nr:DUF928 domain-containing protein [Synechococcales cyanobacterium RM1_1_8]